MKHLRKLLALLLCLSLCASAALAELATPADLPEETPAATESPTAEPTATPEQTEAPTEPPATEEATEAPAATAEPVPADEAWNETLCDHANLRCVRAPACDIPGCAHIGTDEHGLAVPLCPKGRWVLDQQDALALRQAEAGEKPKSVRANVIDLDKADAALYRSGVYTVKGGSKRKASLTVAENRLVVLRLEGATLEELTLEACVGLTVHTAGQNRVRQLTTAQGDTVAFASGGAIRLDAVAQAADAAFNVTGGSVRADFTEAAGRTLHTFEAAGMTAVTVDGKVYAADTTEADGSVALWLRAAGKGMHWEAAMDGTTLAVARAAEAVEDDHRIASGEKLTITEAGTWAAQGALAKDTRIAVQAAGVTIELNGVTVSPSSALIESANPVTLLLFGENRVSGGLLEGGGAVSFEGSGSLTLEDVPAGYTALKTGDTAGKAVTLNGAPYPRITLADGRLILPEPEEGRTYDVTNTAGSVIAKLAEADTRTYQLAQTRHIDTDAARFTVSGTGGDVSGSLRTSAKNAVGTLRSVRLVSKGAALTVAGSAALTTTGDCAFLSDGAGIALENGASLSLNAQSGRLDIGGELPAGITLTGNIRTEPAQEDTVIVQITGKNGRPAANKTLTVQLGGETRRWQTFDDGCLWLCGLGSLDGRAIAATDGTTVYTAVIKGEQAEAIETLKVGKVTFEDQPDGTLKLRCTVEGAGTVGFVYALGEKAVPDTWSADTVYVAAKNGEATVEGLEPGAVLTARACATKAKKAELTAQSADGFLFGEASAHTHRVPFTVKKAPDAEYTGKPYKNPLELPEGATVTYKGKELDSRGRPVKVGKYKMIVTIPKGDPLYLPGEYTIAFEITKIELLIVPAPNKQKYEGQEDPEFDYSVRNLLKGDEVTGKLTREEGEEAGNYKYVIKGLKAPAWYTMRLSEKAPTFVILPLTNGTPEIFEVLHPIRQEIVRKDGRTVAVVLNGQDSLTVTYSKIGSVVYATEDDRERVFSPMLAYNEESDEVLLRLRAEPEQNKDHGYKVDAMGNVLYGNRYFRLSWLGLRGLKHLGVDAVALLVDSAAATLRLDDFLSTEAQAWMQAEGFSLQDTQFRLYVSPADDAEPFSAMLPVTKAWRVSVEMLTRDRSRRVDVTERFPSLTVSIDMEETASLMKSMNRYEETTFPSAFTLYGGTDAPARLDTSFVEPWMPGELEIAGFPAVLSTHRYLTAHVNQAMWVTAAK